MMSLKPGTLVPVPREDGVPVCPHCGLLSVRGRGGAVAVPAPTACRRGRPGHLVSGPRPFVLARHTDVSGVSGVTSWEPLDE